MNTCHHPTHCSPSHAPDPDNEEDDGDKGKGRGKGCQSGIKRRARKEPEPTLASKRQRRQSVGKDVKQGVDVVTWLENVEDCSDTAPPSPISLRGKRGLPV